MPYPILTRFYWEFQRQIHFSIEAEWAQHVYKCFCTVPWAIQQFLVLSYFAFHWAEEHHLYQITIKELFPFTPAFVGIVGPKIAESKNCILYTFSVNMAFDEVISEQTNKDKVLMRLVRSLVLASLKFTVLFCSKTLSWQIKYHSLQIVTIQILGSHIKRSKVESSVGHVLAFSQYVVYLTAKGQ